MELEKKTIRYVERMIELIKFTQYPRTKMDMVQFLFGENATNKNKELNVYLKWKTPFKVFNLDVPIHFEMLKEKGERKTLWYSGNESVHPVFLALNASEVFLLTQVLLSIVYENKSPYFRMYQDIVRKIRKQVSDCMANKVDWSLLDVEADFELKSKIFTEDMRNRRAICEDEVDYFSKIDDYNGNVKVQTLENAIRLMKYMHLPNTRDEINRYMGMDVFKKEITLNDGLKQRGYWKSQNHNNDYCFFNVIFPFCRSIASNQYDHLKEMGYVSTAVDVLDEDIDYFEDVSYTTNLMFDKTSRNYLRYQQTVHPIFLILRLDEVYLLTNHLLELVQHKFKNERIEGLKRYKDTTYIQYENIVSKIYHQLSDYAKDVLCIHCDKNEKDFISEKRHNYEHGITEQNLIMFLKTGETYCVDSIDGLVHGVIRWINDTFYVEDKNGHMHLIIPAKD